MKYRLHLYYIKWSSTSSMIVQSLKVVHGHTMYVRWCNAFIIHPYLKPNYERNKSFDMRCWLIGKITSNLLSQLSKEKKKC